MAYMEWGSDYELGIAVIDEQHKRIVDYINELERAQATGNAAHARQVLEGLVDYTLTHFEFEEQLQEKAGYPFTKAHKRVHEIFTRRVSGFRERCERGEDVTAELLPMLKVWLSTHIKGDDSDYAPAVRKITDPANESNANWLGSTLKRLFA